MQHVVKLLLNYRQIGKLPLINHARYSFGLFIHSNTDEAYRGRNSRPSEESYVLVFSTCFHTGFGAFSMFKRIKLGLVLITLSNNGHFYVCACLVA